jgi:flagellar hook-associated protein 2
MVASSSSSSTGNLNTSSTSNLDSTWVTLIDNTMAAEKAQRLDRLTQQSSDLDTREAMFTDLSTSLTSFKSSLDSLWSTNGSYVGNTARSTNVSNPKTTGTTVLTASADSSAVLGSYNIAVDHLATQNRVSSTTAYTSSTNALALSGGFSIEVNGKSNHFSVNGSDTLYSIASKINSATYTTGNGISASVVNNTLTIQPVSTGAAYNMKMADDTSGGPLETMGILNNDGKSTGLDTSSFVAKAQLQAGVDASFSVNGVSVTRSSNSAITDVISGVTLNLAADANSNNATLTIQSNTSALNSALQSFIKQYNSLQTYLTGKTGYTKVDDTHYTAGDLSNDISITSLKSDLTDQVLSNAGNDATIKNFSAMGITMDDNNQLTISDSTKLSDALKNNASDVQTFLDAKMSKMDGIMSSYVGTNNSYVTYSIASMTQQKTDLSTQITQENTRLDARQAALVSYYQTLDSQMNALLQQQSTDTAFLNAVYGTSSSSSSTISKSV